MNYLNNNNMLLSYTWIKNETSILPPDDLKKISFQNYNLENFDILSIPKIDELYICLSPEFVPPYHHPLFFIWVNIYSAFYKKRFDFED